MPRKSDKFKKPTPQEAAREFMALMDAKLPGMDVPMTNVSTEHPAMPACTIDRESTYRIFLKDYLRYEQVIDSLTTLSTEAVVDGDEQKARKFDNLRIDLEQIITQGGVDDGEIEDVAQRIARFNDMRSLPQAIGIVGKIARKEKLTEFDKNTLCHAHAFLKEYRAVHESIMEGISTPEGQGIFKGMINTLQHLPREDAVKIINALKSGDMQGLSEATELGRLLPLGEQEQKIAARTEELLAYMKMQEIALVKEVQEKLTLVLKSLNIPVEPAAPGRG